MLGSKRKREEEKQEKQPEPLQNLTAPEKFLMKTDPVYNDILHGEQEMMQRLAKNSAALKECLKIIQQTSQQQ